MVELARGHHEALRDDVDGLVLTHGTATLEETAYFLDITLDDPRPVVVTGAMRPISAYSSDAHLNLLNATRVALTASSGRGVLVSLGDHIHAARYATKTQTYVLNAFQSLNSGPLGEVVGEHVHYSVAAQSGPTLALAGSSLPRVDIVMSYAGSDGFAIDAALGCGASAIVVAGFGPGDVTPAELDAMRRANGAGVVIVQASRTLGGQVLTRSDLKDESFIAAARLTPQKARVLTMVTLASGAEKRDLQTLFESAA